MFCKYCGEKLTNAGLPCPVCGRKQPALENGTGFWDLLTPGKAPIQQSAPVVPSAAAAGRVREGSAAAAVQRTARQQQTAASRKRKKSKAIPVLLSALGVFAVLSLVLLLLTVISLKKVHRLEAELAAQQAALAELQEDHPEATMPTSSSPTEKSVSTEQPTTETESSSENPETETDAETTPAPTQTDELPPESETPAEVTSSEAPTTEPATESTL